MGCRKFRIYRLILQVSRDGKLVDGGKFPWSLGSYATIPKAKRGGALNRTKYRYLDAVHMNIAFGDCVFVGGFWYALIPVDRATQYKWTFGLKTLSLDNIILALQLFCASAGSFTCCFYSNCDLNFFGSAVSKFFINGSLKVVSASAKCQSANGLVESHWKGMVHMACTYLTKKQMPRSFWFYAITHVAQLMNTIPGNFVGRLVSLFLLVHGVSHNKRAWIPLFFLCSFHHKCDSDLQCSKHKAHMMGGIVIGHSPTLNSLLVYNPRNKQYYDPDSYRLDPYRLPGSAYPFIKYDSGLFCSCLCNTKQVAKSPLMAKTSCKGGTTPKIAFGKS
jgi:hypothetical protein